ncbi:S-layer protein precursor [Lentilactobacillus parabuchneri]|nr:S-layer family protein [Lentilactobacillus parabuchneri]ORN13368.1 S-layer protein precursor [Lentilactobacillus parabuchneri]
MTTLPQNRNVNFTGSNALYNKAGTLKGAKVVASRTTLNKIKNSQSSTNNVRAYQVAVTNRGSVYYKVVTYDGAYRGWIYGGKSVASIAGGVTQYTTFKNQGLSTLTAAQQSATYKIANPGTANNGTTVTYKQPAWTQYKVGRAITDSTPYASSIFKIDQVGTRTRENDQWVHIYDVNNANSPANGWILMSGLTQAQAPVADNAIQINLVDPSNNSTIVKSVTITRSGATKGTNFGYYSNGGWTISQSDLASIQNQIRAALSGTNYSLDSLTTAQIAQIAQTNFGSSTNLVANKIATIADNAVRINLVKPDGTILKYTDWSKSGVAKGSNVGFSASGNTLWSLYSGDQSSMESQINSALSGTNFQLNTNSNTLNSTQMDAIARGTYGGQVYINVVPVSNATSPIVPRLVGASQALKGTDSASLTAPVTVAGPDGKATAINGTPADKVTTADVLGVITAYAAYTGKTAQDGVNAVNTAFKTAAKTQYLNTNVNLNGYTGASGASFGTFDIGGYISNQPNLKFLKSPSFNSYSYTPNSDPTKQGTVDTSTDNSISFVFLYGDNGKFGSPVNVYYYTLD